MEKQLVTVQQKTYADNLIAAGFTRKEVAKALKEEFSLSEKHATVLVYRWYVGKQYKVKKEDRLGSLSYSKENIDLIQKKGLK